MSTAQRTADAAAASSAVSASVSWLSQANEIVSLIAGLIAICAGVFAMVIHALNIRDKIRDDTR